MYSVNAINAIAYILMLVFLTFSFLVVLTAVSSSSGDRHIAQPGFLISQSMSPGQSKSSSVHRHQRSVSYFNKPKEDWLLDGIGLVMQGIVIPALQVTLIYHFWSWLFPSWEYVLHLSGWLQFVISFVCVDYLYYWNHRSLHHSFLWNVHKVHHTVSEMDVLGTSRNTLWSSFFVVYLWVHALMLFVLDHPNGYVLGVSLTAALDLWRHSRFSLLPFQRKHPLVYRFFSSWLMLPHNHAWHHSSTEGNKNYGGNLNIWDKIHRTYHGESSYPRSIGIKLNLSIIQKLVLPIDDERQLSKPRGPN
ncbi:MAG: sterol desaturase family protein [Cyanobacteria bacterium J06626_14]